MGVQSYLSLYTLLLGWQEYDALWKILANLGFLALPFAFIAIRAFREPFLSMGAKDAGIIGSRRFVINLIAGLLVLLFAGVPTVYLDPGVLHFKPRCDSKHMTATPGHTGTTYDDLLPVPQNVKVPLFWYVVLAWSNGITDQATDTLSCPVVNLRQLQSNLNLSSIQNPALIAQTRRFYNECFLPAYHRYIEDNKDPTQQQAIKASLKKYGQSDVGWIGSETFQTVSGFYNTLYANKPVKGFPYIASNPEDQIEGQVGKPSWGAPSCIDWWQNENHGLRHKLYNQFSKNFKAQLSKISYTSTNPELVQDAAIKAVLQKSRSTYFINPGFSTEEDYKDGVDNFLGKWGAKGYTDVLAVEEYPKIHIIENALPVIQAVLLSAVVMMLALALPMSGYSFGFCITGAVFLFSVTFCSFLWHWVTWLDQFLLHALYGVDSTDAHSSVWRLVSNMAESAVSPEKVLVDITISIFYIFIPLVWLAVCGWAGVQMGQSFFGFTESSGHGASVGKGVSSTGKSAIRSTFKVGKVATKYIKKQ